MKDRFSQDTSEYAYNNIALLALRNTPDAMKNPYLARAAWGQSAYQSSAQLNETIGLAANWTSIKDGPKAVSEYEQAMKDLDAEFKALTPAAMRLGIAIAGVEDEVDRAYVNRQRMLRDQFNKSISQQTLEITDPIKAAVNTLNEQFDLIRRDAKAVGGDMAAVENLYKLRLAQIYEQYGQHNDAAGNLVVSLQAAAEAIVNLRAQADALSVSDLSPLSAADKYRIAEQQFLTQKALAESGNLDAINSLGDYGRQFLEISRFVNGGSASGAEDYFMVVSSLRSIAANLQNSTGLTNDDLTRMTGRASGGMVAPRKMYQVNESGVEMMVPAQHGSVVNASDTQQIARMIQGGAANGDMSRAITGLVSELRRSNNNVDQLVSMLVKNNQIRRTA